MIWQRLITAAVLLPLAILAILFLPGIYFAFLVGIIISVAIWEWSSIIGLKNLWLRALYLAILWSGLLGSQFLSSAMILSLTLLWWCSALVLIIYYQKTGNLLIRGTFSYALIGFLLFIPTLTGIEILHHAHSHYLLWLLFIIWAADSGAYFAGTSCGKHKLIPRVSPNKSLEGLVGGLLLAAIVAIAFAFILRIHVTDWPLWLFISIVTVLFSVVGDLFESMVKRAAAIKDSGTWLPGHGGILDRVDSLLAAIPIFALGVLLFKL